jgi:hypothetical protein
VVIKVKVVTEIEVKPFKKVNDLLNPNPGLETIITITKNLASLDSNSLITKANLANLIFILSFSNAIRFYKANDGLSKLLLNSLLT